MYRFSVLSLFIILLFSCNSQQKSEIKISYSEEIVAQAVPFAPGIISTEANSEFEIMF